MKNVVITCCDKNCSDFLIHHWLTSLLDHSNHENTDIVVFDYGMPTRHAKILDKTKVRRIVYPRNGHPVIIRFRDIASFLLHATYTDVLLIDGGDIIFQDDIQPIFSFTNKGIAAAHETYPPLNLLTFTKNIISISKHELSTVLQGKPTMNAGVILGKTQAIRNLSLQLLTYLRTNMFFGADQVIINYLLHKYGHTVLPEEFNYMPTNASFVAQIKKGIFYHPQTHRPIPIVHNNGGARLFRPIHNFGYGQTFNRYKQPYFTILRGWVKIISHL